MANMTPALKILIVDDDLMMVKTLSDILEFQGYQTFTASSVEDKLGQVAHV